MTNEDVEFLLEVLRSCWTEIEGMEATYDDYVCSGDLEEQVEMAVEILEGALDH